MNQGNIKDRKFALFFRSRIIAVIIMANHANIIKYPNGTKDKLEVESSYNLQIIIYSSSFSSTISNPTFLYIRTA